MAGDNILVYCTTVWRRLKVMLQLRHEESAIERKKFDRFVVNPVGSC